MGVFYLFASIANQHTIQVQWSILKYAWDKITEAYKWQNFLHDPRMTASSEYPQICFSTDI